ncbi:unnamed protein product, partial [Brachionus calyciflorus]
ILDQAKSDNLKKENLKCGFCPSCFDDLNQLKNHLYKDHIEEILNHLVKQSTQPKTQLNPQKLETFCTICKKEVCNKYFLKSHLLNKHGVQLEDYLANQTSSETTQPSSQAALYAAAVANELIENHAQSLSHSTLSQVASQKYSSNNSQFSPNNFDYFLNSTSKLIDEPPVRVEKEEAKSQKINQYLSLALQNSEPVTTNSPVSNTSCELCQKQFCNKYYLKKHKIDVHGLDANQNSSKSTHSIESVQAAATLSMLINPFLLINNNTPAASTDSSVKDEPCEKEETVIEVKEVETSKVEVVDEVKCDICSKVFKSIDFLNLHKMNKHKLKPLSDVQSNVLSNESFCEYCNKSFCNKYFLRTHMSKAHGKTLIIESGQNAQDNNHEDETFYASRVVDRVQCDICQKQVCNKYFLRTHKQKVHGIYDSELSANEENEAGEVMHESEGRRDSNCSDESNISMESNNQEILPSPPSTSASPSQAIDNQNSFCNLCKRKFYSYNFLRHHMNKIHHIKLPKRTFNHINEIENNYPNAQIESDEHDDDLHDDNEDNLQIVETLEHNNEQQEDEEELQQEEQVPITEQEITNEKNDVQIRPKNLVMKKLNRLPLTNSLLNLVNNLKCRMCMKEFKNKPLLKQHVLNSHKIKFTEYLSKYGSIEQSNTSLARSILLNNLFNLNQSPSKKFKKQKLSAVADTGRKRKNSGNSIGHSSIESSASKKSRTSSDECDMNDMVKQCQSLYDNTQNLQAFMIEKDESEQDENTNFTPCLIYLPVKGKINNQISVRIKLKPVNIAEDVVVKSEGL